MDLFALPPQDAATWMAGLTTSAGMVAAWHEALAGGGSPRA